MTANPIHPIKPSFEMLLNSLAQHMRHARDQLAQNETVLDRLVLLEVLAQHFGVRQHTLLQRGFDRAYRQLVEGV